MTERLGQAIHAIEQLPASEQDEIAARLLEEIEDERRWDEAFSNSADRLAEIAEKVRTEIREGKVKPMRLEDL